MVCKNNDPVFDEGLDFESRPADWPTEPLQKKKAPMRFFPKSKAFRGAYTMPSKKTLFECSLLIPGLGQFLLGKTASGFAYLFTAIFGWTLFIFGGFIVELIFKDGIFSSVTTLGDFDLFQWLILGFIHVSAALNAWAIAPDPD